MFRRSIVNLGVSPFTLFVKTAFKKYPQLKGVKPPKSGKMMGQIYRSLPAKELAALKAAAAKAPSFKRKASKAPKADRPKRKASAYNKFVAKFMKANKGTPVTQIMKLAGKAWKAQK